MQHTFKAFAARLATSLSPSSQVAGVTESPACPSPESSSSAHKALPGQAQGARRDGLQQPGVVQQDGVLPPSMASPNRGVRGAPGSSLTEEAGGSTGTAQQSDGSPLPQRPSCGSGSHAAPAVASQQLRGIDGTVGGARWGQGPAIGPRTPLVRSAKQIRHCADALLADVDLLTKVSSSSWA